MGPEVISPLLARMSAIVFAEERGRIVVCHWFRTPAWAGAHRCMRNDVTATVRGCLSVEFAGGDAQLQHRAVALQPDRDSADRRRLRPGTAGDRRRLRRAAVELDDQIARPDAGC